VYPKDFSSGTHSMTISDCNGKPLIQTVGQTYKLVAQSFDYGGIENSDRAKCKNEASITYVKEQTGTTADGTPVYIFYWDPSCSFI
jgi:hypothetical protein